MAIEAAVKAIKHRLAMRQSVTLLTFGNIAVGIAMAESTLQRRVFLCRTGQMLDSFSVTASTGCCRSLFAVMNFGWFMNRMTTDATAVVDKSGVRIIMTFDTVGNIAVAAVVTFGTTDFRVSTWILTDLFRR